MHEYRFCYNLYEEKIHENYADETVLVDVANDVVGQVNALAVYQIGEISFGRPSRITAETFMGRQGVMIPGANVNNLMLNREIIQAVERGRFHIFGVETIVEGIEILTGQSAGTADEKGGYPPETVLAKPKKNWSTTSVRPSN